MNNYVVYKHTSPSGKVYIGITGRKPEHRWASGSGYRAIPFRRAIEKYGWENIKHEVLFSGLTKEEANAKEIELIALYDSTNSKKGYNITRGGNCRFLGENHPLYGKKRPRELVERIASQHRGKPWTENQRRAAEKYFATHKAHNYGCKTPDAVREKQRVAHLGQCRPHTEETKQKISEAHNRHKKAVVQRSMNGEIVATYESITAAAKTIREGKVPKENIRQCCHGQKKTAYGYLWSFIEEVDNECSTFKK